ncbi:PhzF family phenazine biosynthesis protein [bacterium]|nr:PhzF family phenazine biosynthesis protein [bacterium]
MKKFPFKKIDAFATMKSAGNPAGCIMLEHAAGMTANAMLKIAGELKGFVNEVGFVSFEAPGRYRLQFYSSERRVDFCGHAIVGIMTDLIREIPDLNASSSVQILTDRGEIVVENRIRKEQAVYVMAPPPEFHGPVIDPESLYRSLNICADNLNREFPVEIVNAGLKTAIVPMGHLNVILDMMPDERALKTYCTEHDIELVLVFSVQTYSKRNRIRSRVFAPIFGYLEDPATGSGNSALGYYMIRHGIWSGETVSIEQNGLIEKYNIVKLLAGPDESGRMRVYFGGGAVTRIVGEYYISE